MVSYFIEFTPAAKRDMVRLEKDVQKDILKYIEKLSRNPRPRGVEKIDDFYRIRKGDFSAPCLKRTHRMSPWDGAKPAILWFFNSLMRNLFAFSRICEINLTGISSSGCMMAI